MRTIGILGGMSAESTQLYYKSLCALVRERLGGTHSPELIIRSVDFADIEALQLADDWAGAGARLNLEAQRLQAAGADLLVLATNTMHKVADHMMRGVTLPLLHIGDVTAAAICAAGCARPGLIATAYTMEQPFLLDRLRAAGLEPRVPAADDRQTVHRIIFDELVQGVINEDSRAAYVGVAARLTEAGADSIILGCTEVGLLLNAGNVSVPVFDTQALHCAAAIDWALRAGDD